MSKKKPEELTGIDLELFEWFKQAVGSFDVDKGLQRLNEISKNEALAKGLVHILYALDIASGIMETGKIKSVADLIDVVCVIRHYGENNDDVPFSKDGE